MQIEDIKRVLTQAAVAPFDEARAMLMETKLDLEQEMASIRDQLERKPLGVDPDWRRRAGSSLRYHGNWSQRIQFALSNLNAERRAEDKAHQQPAEDFKYALLRVCKRRLDEELYKEIVAEAREEVKKNGGGG